MKCTICNDSKPLKGMSICANCIQITMVENTKLIADYTQIVKDQKQLIMEQNDCLTKQKEQLLNLVTIEDSLIEYFSSFLEEQELAMIFGNLCDYRSTIQ